MPGELQPWESLETSLLLRAAPWLTVYREQVRLPDGRVLDDFYRVELPEFAVVTAVTDRQQLVMVRGYKHGLGRVSLCSPAGMIESGEEPLAAAQRELREETGHAADEWIFLGQFMVDGNRHAGVAHMFVARGARQVAPANQGDVNEELEVVLLSPGEFFQAVRAGEVGLLPTVSAVSLAQALGYLPGNLATPHS